MEVLHTHLPTFIQKVSPNVGVFHTWSTGVIITTTPTVNCSGWPMVSICRSGDERLSRQEGYRRQSMPLGWSNKVDVLVGQKVKNKWSCPCGYLKMDDEGKLWSYPSYFPLDVYNGPILGNLRSFPKSWRDIWFGRSVLPGARSKTLVGYRVCNHMEQRFFQKIHL